MTQGQRIVLVLLLLVLAVVFFAANAHLELASDDVQWLTEGPTRFDQYRQLPRPFFTTSYALFGLNIIPLLILAFSFHAFNGLLVYRLARRLTFRPAAGLVAAAIVLINPLTLTTLTWACCLSYIQGTTLALLALLACGQATGTRGWLRSGWAAVTLLTYGAGLFASHEILLLPIVFLVLSWVRRDIRLGVALLVAGLAIGGGVCTLVYDFGQHGVTVEQVVSVDFVLNYAVTSLALGPALGLAYPLAFVIKPAAILASWLLGPVRWGLVAGAVGMGSWACYQGRKGQRLVLLGVMLLAAVGPYVMRLCLLLPGVTYDPAYLFWGRVLYWPSIPVALGLGWLANKMPQWRWAWIALAALFLTAYAHALVMYGPGDFGAMQVAR